ncbi:MAG: class I SAM-dependent methyltransferase [Bryobacterales bacterium]
MQYQFGDQDLAARRLEVVARVFETTTRELLQRVRPSRTRMAVDLGCGPGFTTRLLAEVLGCDHVAGLDTSERFLGMAREQSDARLRFHRHDVLVTPFPEGPSELIFCRYLLSHLPDPRLCLDSWATQLATGGLLVVEEVEAIDTTHPAFARYLSIVDSMLRSQKTELYVGPVLDKLGEGPLLRRLHSRTRRLPVSNRDAATMFSMNVPNWKDRPFIRETYGDDSIGKLGAELDSLAGGAGSESEIVWTLRQIVFERRAESRTT